jgi:hypothetical protein
VSTQLTGPPVFETADAPAWPHGMPTAGRVSTAAPGDVGGVDVGGVGCARVVGAAVVCDAGELAGGVLVSGGEGLLVGGVVAAGAGGVTTGGGMTCAGAGGAGTRVAIAGGGVALAGVAGASGMVDSAEVVVSTLVGASLDSEAERRALTPKNHASTTTRIVPASAAVCSIRRLCAAFDSSSAIVSDPGDFADVVTSSTSLFGKTSGGATASSRFA